jgi:hypothetical protein
MSRDRTCGRDIKRRYFPLLMAPDSLEMADRPEQLSLLALETPEIHKQFGHGTNSRSIGCRVGYLFPGAVHICDTETSGAQKRPPLMCAPHLGSLVRSACMCTSGVKKSRCGQSLSRRLVDRPYVGREPMKRKAAPRAAIHLPVPEAKGGLTIFSQVQRIRLPALPSGARYLLTR